MSLLNCVKDISTSLQLVFKEPFLQLTPYEYLTQLSSSSQIYSFLYLFFRSLPFHIAMENHSIIIPTDERLIDSPCLSLETGTLTITNQNLIQSLSKAPTNSSQTDSPEIQEGIAATLSCKNISIIALPSLSLCKSFLSDMITHCNDAVSFSYSLQDIPGSSVMLMPFSFTMQLNESNNHPTSASNLNSISYYALDHSAQSEQSPQTITSKSRRPISVMQILFKAAAQFQRLSSIKSVTSFADPHSTYVTPLSHRDLNKPSNIPKATPFESVPQSHHLSSTKETFASKRTQDRMDFAAEADDEQESDSSSESNVNISEFSKNHPSTEATGSTLNSPPTQDTLTDSSLGNSPSISLKQDDDAENQLSALAKLSQSKMEADLSRKIDEIKNVYTSDAVSRVLSDSILFTEKSDETRLPDKQYTILLALVFVFTTNKFYFWNTRPY